MKIAITGAFGYSGRYITERLLASGHDVITLTNSLRRENPFGDRVPAFPFQFDEPELLQASLQGVDALINTYWVRFDHPRFSQRAAVANTKILFATAKQAGIRRIVHISITNPDIHSDLPYFKGKAELESALSEVGVSYCILRPAVLFGKEDILINNIAWSLRHFPVFGVFGTGDYKLQPIYVDDLAAVAVQKARGNTNEILNAIGPETFTYRELAETIRRALHLRTRTISVPPELGYWACRLMGFFVRDVIITRDEIKGLMRGLLCVNAPALGNTRLTDWIGQHRDTLGHHYASEMARRLDRTASYEKL
jgi:NADH dehydrogenase